MIVHSGPTRTCRLTCSHRLPRLQRAQLALVAVLQLLVRRAPLLPCQLPPIAARDSAALAVSFVRPSLFEICELTSDAARNTCCTDYPSISIYLAT